MQINMVSIMVSDIEESEEFYKNILGMEKFKKLEISDNMKIVYYKDSYGTQIELIENKINKGITNYNGVSLGIITDRYDEILKISRRKRILLSEPEALDENLESYFVRDPDGFTLQLIKEL